MSGTLLTEYHPKLSVSIFKVKTIQGDSRSRGQGKVRLEILDFGGVIRVLGHFFRQERD